MKLMFSEHAWGDYFYWHRVDPKLVQRIHKRIEEAQCSPFSGLGKPERFRHRMVYQGWMMHATSFNCACIAEYTYQKI
ncbi:MAG: type II toxin-antitoxin system YoeB family toxin [Deinococcaceae bacterium]